MSPYLDPSTVNEQCACLNRELRPRVRFGHAWFPCYFKAKQINAIGKVMYRVSPLLHHEGCVIVRDTVVRIDKAVTFLAMEAEVMLCETYQVENTGKLSPYGHDRVQAAPDCDGVA